MNDTQLKENVLSAATETANKQYEQLKKAKEQTYNAKSAYLNSVILAAITSEGLRRKNDAISVLVLVGIFVIFSLITILINIFIGIAFIIAFITLWILIHRKKKIERAEEYNNRHSFFLKYSYAMPENAFDWRNVTESEPQESSGDWTCPTCTRVNGTASHFCTSCGEPREF